jgi:hypothetical protein
MVRARLVESLRSGGAATPQELLPEIEIADLSLSEIIFQLGRLTEEARVVAASDGAFAAAAGGGG